MIDNAMQKTPRAILLTINIMAMVLLYFYKGEIMEQSLIYVILFLGAIYITNILLGKVSSGDHYMYLIVSLLVSIGVFMIYRINPDLGIKQMIFSGVGIAAFFGTHQLLKRLNKLQDYTLYYLIISYLLYLLTFLIGSRIGGAKNWIVLGPISIQPAEMIKILYVFFMASFYVNRTRIKEQLGQKFSKLQNLNDNLYTALFMAVCYSFIGFLFLQSELGISLLFFLVFNTILYVFEPNRKMILINIVGAMIMGVVGYFLFAHVRLRVDIWLNPWDDVHGRGYQIVQSLFAIAEGGFFGTGIGLGNPDYVPEVHTDFIFSAISEEMGIFAGIAVMLMFMILIYRGIKVTLSQKDRFYKIVALGITSTFAFQAFIILGGVIGMIPLTGITLPFISYGGSSLVTSFVSLGILQFASEEIEVEDFDDEDQGQ